MLTSDIKHHYSVLPLIVFTKVSMKCSKNEIKIMNDLPSNGHWQCTLSLSWTNVKVVQHFRLHLSLYI